MLINYQNEPAYNIKQNAVDKFNFTLNLSKSIHLLSNLFDISFCIQDIDILNLCFNVDAPSV